MGEARKRTRDAPDKFTFDDTPCSHRGNGEQSYHHSQWPSGTFRHAPLPALCVTARAGGDLEHRGSTKS